MKEQDTETPHTMEIGHTVTVSLVIKPNSKLCTKSMKRKLQVYYVGGV